MSTTTTTPGVTAANLLRAGLTITSTATPAINGTYTVLGALDNAFQAECNAVALNGTFADGTENLNWPDRNNAIHSFSVANFKNFAGAISNFINLCTQYSMGTVTAAPSASATIP
jgi:hypothetical protein